MTPRLTDVVVGAHGDTTGRAAARDGAKEVASTLATRNVAVEARKVGGWIRRRADLPGFAVPGFDQSICILSGLIGTHGDARR